VVVVGVGGVGGGRGRGGEKGGVGDGRHQGEGSLPLVISILIGSRFRLAPTTKEKSFIPRPVKKCL